MALQRYVSHYWLSRCNPDKTHSVLPDGSVDLVIVVGGGISQEFVFGTTTSRNDLPLELGSHYLGVSFKPGQSRHFLRAASIELTNSTQPALGLLTFDLRDIPEHVQCDEIFFILNAVLEKHLLASPPLHSKIDAAIQYIESTSGVITIPESAAIFGKSIRQFERHFRETVGVNAKLFTEITRFRRASRLISLGTLPLAQIAADLGYSDQSHMSREFKRFTDLPPTSYARSHVVFLQDYCHPSIDNGDS